MGCAASAGMWRHDGEEAHGWVRWRRTARATEELRRQPAGRSYVRRDSHRHAALLSRYATDYLTHCILHTPLAYSTRLESHRRHRRTPLQPPTLHRTAPHLHRPWRWYSIQTICYRPCQHTSTVRAACERGRECDRPAADGWSVSRCGSARACSVAAVLLAVHRRRHRRKTTSSMISVTSQHSIPHP
jgi:hypothetical protein